MAVKITLVKGLCNCRANQKATVKALGLNKIGSSVVKENNGAIAGMIKTVAHLVKVEEVDA